MDILFELYIYIYIYARVCVCVSVTDFSHLPINLMSETQQLSWLTTTETALYCYCQTGKVVQEEQFSQVFPIYIKILSGQYLIVFYATDQ